MVNEENNMFEDVIDEVTSNEETVAPEEENSVTFDLSKLSGRAPSDRVERVDMNGMTVGIEKIEITVPKVKEADGTKIEPTQSQSKKSYYYQTRLGVFFDHENQREYMPGIKWFVKDDGTVQNFPSIPNNGKSVVAKLYQMVAAKIGKTPEDLSPQEFVSFLNMKPKVKLVSEKWDHNGKSGIVNRISEIL